MGEPLSSRSSAWLGASIEVSRDGERGGEPSGWVGVPREAERLQGPALGLWGAGRGALLRPAVLCPELEKTTLRHRATNTAGSESP